MYTYLTHLSIPFFFALGSSVRHAAGYGAVLAYAAYFVTEAGEEHHRRLTTKGELLPDFLKVPNDPFASRIQKQQ